MKESYHIIAFDFILNNKNKHYIKKNFDLQNYYIHTIVLFSSVKDKENNRLHLAPVYTDAYNKWESFEGNNWNLSFFKERYPWCFYLSKEEYDSFLKIKPKKIISFSQEEANKTPIKYLRNIFQENPEYFI